MATNVYFNNYEYFNEQQLIDDLVIESIQIFGMDALASAQTFIYSLLAIALLTGWLGTLIAFREAA